jgi:hypothetical protein
VVAVTVVFRIGDLSARLRWPWEAVRLFEFRTGSRCEVRRMKALKPFPVQPFSFVIS